METRLPVALHPLMDAYLQALEPLRDHFYGIYIYGSVALDAFEEQESDIDIVALMQGEWTSRELMQLKALHTPLLREQPLGKLLDVLYLPLRDLGKHGKTTPHPILRDGKFVSATHGGLNAVTWWITKHQGIRLLGPDPSALPLDVAWKEVLAAMRFNLDGYWAGKAKRPYLFWFDYWVMTAVATLCRILTAIEEGEIIAKSPALLRWRDRFPERWQHLVHEAWRIRHHLDQPMLYHSRLKRASETLTFITYVRKRGHEALAASSV
jgi:hypothetical protein